ncbi:MAG: cytochrome c oxidase subunit II [Dehalococcoidia bacterium]|nr:cytochrome c oxidase subunit II [Dehalococcoidia bacterium]
MGLRYAPLRPLLFVLAGALLILVIAGCSSTDPQSTFYPKGPAARDQLNLFLLIFWLAVAVFVVVEGALLYAVIRFRRRKDQTELPKQVHGNNKLEIAWTILPVIVLAVIAIPTYITIHKQKDPPPDPTGKPIMVDVVGHQWWWEFKYPELGIVTATEMHIPVGRTVTFTLFSDDVVHSFWVPKLAGKTDVFPLQVNEGWFVADEPGTYFGLCAELCGLSHAQMRFKVVAQTQADFDAWIAAQKAPPAPAPAGLAARGATLFATKECVLCHTNTGPDGEGVQASRARAFENGGKAFAAPNLTHFATRKTFAGSIVDTNGESLAKWLLNPDNYKPGNRMAQLASVYTDPAKQLTRDEIDALVAYLLSRN